MHKRKIDFSNKRDRSMEKENIYFLMSKKRKNNNHRQKNSKRLDSRYGSKYNAKTENSGNKKKPERILSKRRGRKPKKILENIDDLPQNTPMEDSNRSAIILRLNICPKKLESHVHSNSNVKEGMENKQFYTEKIEVGTRKETKEMDEKLDGMFRNDIPGDSICSKCSRNEKIIASLKAKLGKYEKREKDERINKIYNNKLKFISYKTGERIIIRKTNIKCWWDAHGFNNLPCFLPEMYYRGIYHVSGCFCSFNCALAYNLYYLRDSKVFQRKSLIYKLYREMYGLGPDDPIEIKEAPPKELLEAFGGEMTIDVYRRKFTMIHREYLVYTPPIKPINIQIEERNVEPFDDYEDQKYVLKRSKPLFKRGSIISSMKIKMDDDDS
ncbi:MAG: hypothetical protein QXW79_01040 [Thermoplasmata archaeon]